MAKLKREPADYIKLNKKKTKVKITGTPKMLGLTGVLVQAGLPFAYLSVRYDLFTFRDAGYALTGWGVVGLFGAFLIFRDKIKDAMKEADASFGITYQRSKLAITMAILSIVVVLTNFFVEAFVLLFMIIAGSTLVSLPFYKPYDEVLALKKAMQEELKKRNIQNDLAKVEAKLNT
jgi:hypothetical protein